MVPYTLEVFLGLQGRVNAALWPLPLLGAAAGLVLAFVVWRRGATRLVWFALAAGWVAVGLGYHRVWLAELSWGAPWFAAGFCLQGALLLLAGVWQVAPVRPGAVGSMLVVLAAAIHPVAAALSHGWSGTPVFALAPLPTVLLTLGVLSAVPLGRRLVLGLLPLSWAAFNGYESWVLENPLDLVLPAGGLAVLVLSLREAVVSGLSKTGRGDTT